MHEDREQSALPASIADEWTCPDCGWMGIVNYTDCTSEAEANRRVGEHHREVSPGCDTSTVLLERRYRTL